MSTTQTQAGSASGFDSHGSDPDRTRVIGDGMSLRRPGFNLPVLSIVDEEGGVSRAEIPFAQPVPRITQVAYLRIAGRTVTAITRRWKDGEPERCKLCPHADCTAYEGSCTIIAGRRVPMPEAPLYVRLGTSSPVRGLAGPRIGHEARADNL